MPRPGKSFWLFGLSRIETKVLIGGYRGMAAWGMLVAQQAKTGGDVPVDTSHLIKNIRSGTVQVEPLAKFSILIGTGSEVPYTRAHEMGSGLFAEFGERKKIDIWAGKLNPKTKSLNPKMALSFKWPNGPGEDHPAYNPETGKYVFGKVEHPGVKAKHFLRNAVLKTEERGKKIFMLAIKTQLAGAG